jgi:hypothetical protein
MTAANDDARMRGGRRVKTRTGNSNRDYSANLLAVQRWTVRLSAELLGLVLFVVAVVAAVAASWITAL